MKPRFATEPWWIASLSMLLVANAILVYWTIVEKLGWQNGYFLGDIIYHLTFFPGLFLSPAAAFLGFLCAVDFVRVGRAGRAAVLAFLSGGAALTAYVSWAAILSGGR